MPDKGWYASAYATLLDSPEYEALSSDAAAVWWALKFCPENNQLGVFVFFNEQVAHRAKVPMERVQAAIRELEAGQWIRTDGRWVWLRNHLKFDPNYNPANPKQAKGLLSKLGRLPWMPLTEAFVKYYQRLGYISKGYRYPIDTVSKARPRPADAESIPVAVAVTSTSTVTSTNETERAAPAAPPNVVTWSKRVADAYESRFGVGTWDERRAVRFNKATQRLRREYDTERVVSAWEWYITRTDEQKPNFLTPENFAGAFLEWERRMNGQGPPPRAGPSSDRGQAREDNVTAMIRGGLRGRPGVGAGNGGVGDTATAGLDTRVIDPSRRRLPS